MMPRALSGIGVLVIAATCVLAVAGFGTLGWRQREQLEARTDSIVRIRTLEAVILRRDAAAAFARAETEKRRADSLEAIAVVRRADVVTKVARAAASRALVVDSTALPDAVIQALADADSLRLAVTPALAADAAAIAGLKATIAHLEATIALQDSAFRVQAAALAARDAQVRSLEAPRCGWKCGALVGGLTYLVARFALP